MQACGQPRRVRSDGRISTSLGTRRDRVGGSNRRPLQDGSRERACIPLTRRACGALTLWLSRTGEAGPDTFVVPVPSRRAGRQRPQTASMGNRPQPADESVSYKTAFKTARETAKVDCRFYDARHSFVTRLAENPTISEETIRQLAGHVSPRMLSRYAHIRAQARRDAIATLERQGTAAKAKIEGDSPQNPPQSADSGKPFFN